MACVMDTRAWPWPRVPADPPWRGCARGLALGYRGSWGLLPLRGQYFQLLFGSHGSLPFYPFIGRVRVRRGACGVPAGLRSQDTAEGRSGQERRWVGRGLLSVRNFECERNESWGASVQGSAKKGTCGLGRRVESRLPAWVGGSPCWDGGRTVGNSATALCWALTHTPFTLSPPCGSSGLPLPGEAEARKVKLPTRAAQPAGLPHPAGASRTRGAPPSSPYSPTAPSPSSCQVRHPGLVTLRRSLGGGRWVGTGQCRVCPCCPWVPGCVSSLLSLTPQGT